LIEAVHTEGVEPPAEYIEAEVCRMFSVLPSQLEGEDYGKMVRMVTMLGIADKTRAT